MRDIMYPELRACNNVIKTMEEGPEKEQGYQILMEKIRE